MRHHRLRVAATADQPEHAIADGEPLDARPQRVDFARKLEPWNVGRRIGRRRICAHALQQICTVHRGGPNPDAHFATRCSGSGRSTRTNVSGPPGLVIVMALIMRE